MHNTKIFIGIILLVSGMLVFSLVSSYYLNRSAQKIDYQIRKIEANSRSNDWINANIELSNLEKQWKKSSNTWAMLIDHVEIDNIDDSLTRMKEYIKAKNSVLSLGELASLKQYVNHIPQKESFSLINIF
ncbi:DUF4363 family protein [Pseudobacteroides cellulosolvens]|uniref:DUF4363 family protein n=1 Tax=Pseudobacteroides cellulosolvens ATCC 35603 = DSM 2933 TaxID=398512 RepID=A0A0L6JN29_9FIRM|nr:DUF4363 family protein [Pseudobacteroides cellulosolvens]KNY26782.1 Protein of unknown function DUF4363 [Pseudobacteroides cellulosolvens ATCC 35603 = DSM 2933]